MNDRYHHAAKDGYLAPLKQATKKDLNQPDEEGLTPTLWAAYHGNLDALRLCCSRGGDPDKCDYTGNTALHFAASNGHMNCLTFLVSFGANVWQMDNDYHTIMDVASIREKSDCVRYLDGVIARQQALDKKMVSKLQDRAKKDAEKRIEKYQKMQAKQDKRFNREGQTENPSKENKPKGTFGTSRSKGTAQRKSRFPDDSSMPYSQVTHDGKNKSTLQKMIGKQKRTSTTTEPDNAFKISEDGRQTVRSITGVRSERVQNVIYMPGKSSTEDNKVNQGSTSGRRRVRDVFPRLDHDESFSGDPVSRSGAPAGSLFGTLALRNNFNSANSMYSALDPESNHSYDPTIPRSTRPPTYSTSIGSAGSLIGNDHYDNFSEDEDYMDSSREATPLDTFLESQNLSEYSNLFKEEKMDMDALHLCSLEDLKEMGLPLGPRKKIMDALQHREAAIQSPADMDITQF